MQHIHPQICEVKGDNTTQTTAAKHRYAEHFLFQFVLWKSVRNAREQTEIVSVILTNHSHQQQ